MDFNVFQYKDFVDLLDGLLKFKKEQNPMYSLRAWATQLGYRYPSYLSQCIRRERAVNAEFMRRFLEKENFNDLDREYISFLYLLHCTKGLENLEIEKLFDKFFKESEIPTELFKSI